MRFFSVVRPNSTRDSLRAADISLFIPQNLRRGNGSRSEQLGFLNHRGDTIRLMTEDYQLFVEMTMKNRPAIPNLLHHYTTMEGLLGIVRTGKMWLTHVSRSHGSSPRHPDASGSFEAAAVLEWEHRPNASPCLRISVSLIAVEMMRIPSSNPSSSPRSAQARLS